jgi:hypothetical protein
MAPELFRTQYDALAYVLERCVIYDAGSRAFDVPTYVDDVRSFWEQVLELALDGLTLEEALEERWPEPWRESQQAFLEFAHTQWQGVDPHLVDSIWQAAVARRRSASMDRAGTAEALAILARRRLDDLPRPPE